MTEMEPNVFPAPQAGGLPQAPKAPELSPEPPILESQGWKRSETIGALAAALAKAQGQMRGATKDSINPHFKNQFASLSSIWEACREALSTAEISVIQLPSAAGRRVSITTLLAHSSGEWIESTLTMLATQDTPQQVGSAITYARRYGLAPMVGIAPADDDGEEASRTLPQGIRQDAGKNSEIQKAAAGATVPVGGAGPASTGSVQPVVPQPPAAPLPSPKAAVSQPAPSAALPPPPGMKPPMMKPPMKAPGS